MNSSADGEAKSQTHTCLGCFVTYAAAIASAAAAFIIYQALSYLVGPGLPPYILFYPAVMLVALLAGMGPGLLATAVAEFTVIYWILPMEGHLAPARVVEILGTVVFLGMGVFISVVAELYRRARERAATYKQEISLHESETRFSSVFHTNPIGMNITRFADGQYLDVNESFLSLFGYMREEILHHTATELETWAAPEERNRFIRTLRDQGSVRSVETRHRRKSGEILIALVSAELIEVSGERCILTLLQDITERKRAEAMLRESEEHFRDTLDNMMEGCQILGFDWRYLYINKAAEKHNRRSNEELLTKKYLDMWPGIETTEVFKVIQRCMEERVTQRIENEFVFPDGTVGWFELSIQPVPQGVFILSQDITERKRSEKALSDSQRLLKVILDLVPQFIFAKDRNSRHVLVNLACAEANGMKPDQMVGLRDLDFVRDQAQAKSFMSDDLEIIESGKPKIRFEERLTDATGRTRILQTTKIPFTLPGTAQTALLGVSVDITELKLAEAEVQKLNAELERRVHERTVQLEAANKELEAFAYAVSHDLRAPLRALDGFSQALSEDYGPKLSGEAHNFLDQIVLASRHMGELIDGLLTLSRSTRGELQLEEVDLSAHAEAILAEHAKAEPFRRVTWTVEPGLGARCDSRLIEVVLTNLLDNAWKYTAGTPEPTIRFYAEHRGNEHIYCVADNGAGFDMRHADKLFQPFQRLHRQEEFPGIGIGLATVQRIVHRHGGIIRATGTPGKGATFSFSLS